MKERLLWWARAGEVARMGPYKTQADASRATIGLDGNPVAGAFTWPETPSETRARAGKREPERGRGYGGLRAWAEGVLARK